MYYSLRQCCGLVRSGTIFGAFQAKRPLGVAYIPIGISKDSTTRRTWLIIKSDNKAMDNKVENRLNEQIRALEVRLISIDGEQLGVVPIQQAMQLAQDAGVDLVEVAPEAKPPVCRIMDFKKLQYEKQRKMKEARKHQRLVEVKGLRLRPAIDEHDYQTKLNYLRSFLLKGFKVRINIIFRGRELRRYELGTDLLDRLIENVKDIASLEPGSRSQRRQITALIIPSKEVEAEVARKAKLLEKAGKPPISEPEIEEDDFEEDVDDVVDDDIAEEASEEPK